ncbi:MULTISPECIES: hypothetical protein [unclassified Streptomyces]|uniref:hypothetical protein n=1 Tax=unclassified Streptomyces TaxID=2593676 RepID=UPI0036FA0239
MTEKYDAEKEEQEAVLFRHKVDGREFEATETSIPSIDFLDSQEEYERVDGTEVASNPTAEERKEDARKANPTAEVPVRQDADVKRPNKGASKADWVSWAVSERGLSLEEANAMTREDLIALADKGNQS